MSEIDTPIKQVEKAFGISNLRSAMIGGMVAGFNLSSGSETTTSNGCYEYLTLFPELAELEKESGNAFQNIGLSTIWNVGFAAAHEKISSPDYFSGNSIKYLKNRKLKTVDQIFSRRSENTVTTFFSCFKKNGMTTPIVDESWTKKMDWSSDMDELIRYGLICSYWIAAPQTIYYYASVDGQFKSQDYLYLIAGDDPKFFKPQELLKHLLGILKLITELDKSENKKSVTQEVKKAFDALTAKDKIWSTFKYNELDELTKNHQVTKAAVLTNYFNRACHSVFNFYNYLIHAKKHLNIQTITEVGTMGERKIKIEELIQNYSEVYNFCKNITLLQYNGS